MYNMSERERDLCLKRLRRQDTWQSWTAGCRMWVEEKVKHAPNGVPEVSVGSEVDGGAWFVLVSQLVFLCSSSSASVVQACVLADFPTIGRCIKLLLLGHHDRRCRRDHAVKSN